MVREVAVGRKREIGAELLSVKARVVECLAFRWWRWTDRVELPNGALPEVVTVTVAMPDVVIDCGLTRLQHQGQSEMART